MNAAPLPDPPSPSREREIFIRLEGNRLIITDQTGLFGIPSELRGEPEAKTAPRRKRSVANPKAQRSSA